MGTGKKKIEIKKKDKPEDRMITFSKRKRGLFRKASQLNALSGSHIGIVVFSPAGRPHTNSPIFDHALPLYLSSIGADDDSGTFSGGSSADEVSTWLNSVENLLLGSTGGEIYEWLNSIEVEKIEKLEDLLLMKQRLEIIGGRGGPGGMTTNVDQQKQFGGSAFPGNSTLQQPVGISVAMVAAAIMAQTLGAAQTGGASNQVGALPALGSDCQNVKDSFE